MISSPPPAPGAKRPDECLACGQDIGDGRGRFVVAAGSVCVACYDKGFRIPPPAGPAPVG